MLAVGHQYSPTLHLHKALSPKPTTKECFGLCRMQTPEVVLDSVPHHGFECTSHRAMGIRITECYPSVVRSLPLAFCVTGKRNDGLVVWSVDMAVRFLVWEGPNWGGRWSSHFVSSPLWGPRR